MTFRPLRPKVKAPEGLAAGDFVKVEWAVAGKGKRIDKIEKMERPARRGRPAAEVSGQGEGKGKGKGEMKRDQAQKGQGKGQGKGKGEMKQKRDRSCEGCPKAQKD